MLTKLPRKRSSPDKPKKFPNNSVNKCTDDAVPTNPSNKKAKVQPKYFIFPDTATPRNKELNEASHPNTPKFTTFANQEREYTNQISPTCLVQKPQLSINTEVLPSPTFRIEQSFVGSPIFERESNEKKETQMVLPSPISAWLLSPLALHSYGFNFPDTPNMMYGIRSELEIQESNKIEEINLNTDYSPS